MPELMLNANLSASDRRIMADTIEAHAIVAEKRRDRDLRVHIGPAPTGLRTEIESAPVRWSHNRCRFPSCSVRLGGAEPGKDRGGQHGQSRS
jgi:hypothetical protein